MALGDGGIQRAAKQIEGVEKDQVARLAQAGAENKLFAAAQPDTAKGNLGDTNLTPVAAVTKGDAMQALADALKTRPDGTCTVDNMLEYSKRDPHFQLQVAELMGTLQDFHTTMKQAESVMGPNVTAQLGDNQSRAAVLALMKKFDMDVS